MEPGLPSPDIDTSRPHPARMYDYYLGGTDNYPADREAAEAVLRVAPVVREAARVLYVDNDPVVQMHANALLTGDPHTRVALADLRDPAAILAHPQVTELIDFSRPVALLLLGVLYFITDEEAPRQLIGAYRDAPPPRELPRALPWLRRRGADGRHPGHHRGVRPGHRPADAPHPGPDQQVLRRVRAGAAWPGLPAAVASRRCAAGSAGGVEDRHVRRRGTQTQRRAALGLAGPSPGDQGGGQGRPLTPIP